MSFLRRASALLLGWVLLATFAALTPSVVNGASSTRTLLSTDEVLELAFPECAVTRETLYLTKQQKKRATKLAGKRVETAIVYVYTARKDGKLVGYAYFDTHKVRSKRETIMIAVDPSSRIRRIEVVAFAEPTEYLPRGNWYAQFLGKKLDDNLRIKRAIHPVSGATLTANATTDAVRRTLALHRVALESPIEATHE